VTAAEKYGFADYQIPEGLDVHNVRKKPAVVQSVLVTTENMGLIKEWIEINGHAASLENDRLIIQTLEGPFTARPGSQVMCGLQGEFYAHEGGDFFKQAYDDLGSVER
jgi:hypothetical protein